MLDRPHIDELLCGLARRFRVPGAAACVICDGAELVGVAGQAHVPGDVPVVPGTCFQVGSIAKAYTATAMMALAAHDDQLLDRPVATILPDFRVADDVATATLTPRHLLTHTSGLSGDHFPDVSPRACDQLAAYVRSCASLGSVHPVGAMASYCNSGFVIAGRIVEVVAGQPWSAALDEIVLAPTQLSDTFAEYDDVPDDVVAYGHVEDGDLVRPASPTAPPRYFGPSGALWATVADLARFGASQLGPEHGRPSPLTARALETMQSPQAQPPRHAWADRVGIGWSLYQRGGRWLIGHDGNVCAQWAGIRVDRERGAAVAVACNGGRGEAFQQAALEALLAAVDPGLAAGAQAPVRRTGTPGDAVFAGRYRRDGVQVDVATNATGLAAHMRYEGTMRSVVEQPEETISLVGVAGEEGVFVIDEPSDDPPAYQTFVDDGNGGWNLLLNSRLTPRCPPVASEPHVPPAATVERCA